MRHAVSLQSVAATYVVFDAVCVTASNTHIKDAWETYYQQAYRKLCTAYYTEE